MDRNLTTAEVADIFRTSPETVRYWRHVGRGPRSFKVGRRVLYREQDVATWAEAARSTDTAPSVPVLEEARTFRDALVKIQADPNSGGARITADDGTSITLDPETTDFLIETLGQTPRHRISG